MHRQDCSATPLMPALGTQKPTVLFRGSPLRKLPACDFCRLVCFSTGPKHAGPHVLCTWPAEGPQLPPQLAQLPDSPAVGSPDPQSLTRGAGCFAKRGASSWYEHGPIRTGQPAHVPSSSMPPCTHLHTCTHIRDPPGPLQSHEAHTSQSICPCCPPVLQVGRVDVALVSPSARGDWTSFFRRCSG